MRPDISRVGAGRASVLRCRRSLLLTGGRCWLLAPLLSAQRRVSGGKPTRTAGPPGPRTGSGAAELRITGVSRALIAGFTARASFRFTGCCWWRSLAADGGSGGGVGLRRLRIGSAAGGSPGPPRPPWRQRTGPVNDRCRLALAFHLGFGLMGAAAMKSAPDLGR